VLQRAEEKEKMVPVNGVKSGSQAKKKPLQQGL